MQRLKQPMPPQSRRRQRGISLIESLIALVVAALGILGVVGVQMRTLTDTSTTVRRAQAIRLIEDFSERLKVNPNALTILSSYESGFSATVSEPANKCTTDPGCTNAQQAAFDVATWKETIKNSLPAGDASIFIAPGETAENNRRQLGVMIAWRENEREGTKTDDIDATKVRDKDGKLQNAAGTAVSCPSSKTCHLQYITVSARCAPYDNGSTTFSFHCS